MPKKRKADTIAQADRVAPESSSDADLRTQVTLDKKVVEKVLKTHFFIKNVNWETKVSYFKLLDACKDFPSDKPVNLDIAYSRARDTDGPIGRLKAPLDINGLWRPLKQTILGDYYDLDVKSCHASLMLYVAKKNNYDVHLPHLEQLVNRKQEAIESVCDQYEIDANQAKQFLTSLLYGGGYESFYNENNIPISKRDKNVQIDNIKIDIHKFLSCLQQTFVYKRYLQYAEKRAEEKTNSKKPKKTETQIEYKAMAYFLQTIECNLLLEVIHFIETKKKKTRGKSPLYLVPAHDGLYIHKKNVDELFGSLDTFVQQVNTYVATKYLGNIMFVEKPMTEHIDLEKEPQTDIDYYSDLDTIHMPRLTSALALDITKRCKMLKLIHNEGYTIYMWNGIVWTRNDKEQESLLNTEVKRQICMAADLSRYFYTGAPNTTEQYDQETNTTKTVPSIWSKIRKCWVDSLDKYLSGAFYRALSDCIPLHIEKITESIFDNNPYIFCFRNVYYDLKTGKQFDPDPNLYMTTHSGYDYDVPEDVEEKMQQVDKFFHEIIDIDTERQNLIWWLGTGLIAQHYELFYVAQGSGGNGKSLLNGYMRHCIGNYFYDCPQSIIYGSSKDSSSSANPDLYCTNGKRYGVVCEPTKTMPMDPEKLKKLTGQNEVTARNLYKGNGPLKVQISLTIECNTIPTLTADGGIKRRFFGTQFLQKFTTNVEKWKKIYKRMNLPISRVKQANPKYAREQHLRSMRIPFFLYLQKHLQSFFDREELFHESENAMCKVFTEDEVIDTAEPEDDYQDIMSWWNGKYEFVPPKTDTDILQIMSKMLTDCDKLTDKDKRPWESEITKNPLNQYSTPLSAIYKDYKKSYHGPDKEKTYADFKKIFTQQTQMSGCILSAGVQAWYGMEKREPMTKAMWDTVLSTLSNLSKEVRNRFKGKGYLRDTHEARVMHYLPISIKAIEAIRKARIDEAKKIDNEGEQNQKVLSQEVLPQHEEDLLEEDFNLPQHYEGDFSEEDFYLPQHHEEDFPEDFYTPE